MGWLKGSSREGRRQCHEKHGDEATWDQARSSDLSYFDEEDINRAIALSIAEDDGKAKGVTEKEFRFDEDEHIAKTLEEEEAEEIAKAIQESLNVYSAPLGNSLSPYPFVDPSGYRICAGCNGGIDHEGYLSQMGAVWHPECFRCHSCNRPVSEYELFPSDNLPYHKSCYKELHDPKCDVCKNYIPTNAAGLIESREHPFWLQKYCPSHEHDGTPCCCSCERMEPVETRYLILDDGRKLCLECFASSIMDMQECWELYLEIQEFYERLNMKVEQQIPLLLVERQALNEAMEGEKKGHHNMPETRGLCLSEVPIVSTISRMPTIGGNPIIPMFMEPSRPVRKCEVTAILVLYGLPRLLTGSILAHEMMHAWLRLKGYKTLSPTVEEGICQVLACMWLDPKFLARSLTTNMASTSSSSSTSNSTTSSSKKGKRSKFEKKLRKFFIYQIESDPSMAYGDGFREGKKAVAKYGLKRTLDHILLTGCFP